MNPSQLTAVGNDLFYMTLETDETHCLRVSDGVARATDSWSCAYWFNGYAWGNLTNVGGTLFLTFGSNVDPDNQFGWALYYIDCSQYPGGCTEYSWLKRVEPEGTPRTFADHDLTDVAGTLFFVARDPNDAYGMELWAYAQ
jgi:hypothetical protein